MAGVLEGIVVIDLAQGWAGPLASMYLADQGAEVIKVEPPTGDMARSWYSSPALKGTGRSFLAINRNKRGLAVDITQVEGKQIVYDLATAADVIVLSLPTQADQRLGLSYATLSSLNPRLVYANVSGYGQRGPYAGRPAYDSVIQGLTGAMSRRLSDGTPVRAGVWVADCSAPMLLAYGVTLALLARERTGRGQKVETSLLKAATALQAVDLVYLDRDPDIPQEEVTSQEVYRCGDGKFIAAAAYTERQAMALCRALGLEQVLERRNFPAEYRDHSQVQSRWRAEMAEAFFRRPADEWLRLLAEADVPCAPVLTKSEVFHEPQLLESEAIVPMDHPEAGTIMIASIPVGLSDNPGSIRLPAPSLGQHTTEVLQQLGYTPEQIRGLRARQVVV